MIFTGLSKDINQANELADDLPGFCSGFKLSNYVVNSIA